MKNYAPNKERLEDRLAALTTENEALSLLLNNIDIPMLFLDTQLCIRRFTPVSTRLFDLSLKDIGCPVSAVSHPAINLELMLRDAEQVLTHQKTLEREVCSDNAHCFIQRIRPVHTAGQVIDGIVLTFIDVTRLVREQRLLARSKERAECLLKFTGEAIYGVDDAGRCIFVNDRFSKQSGYSSDELMGIKLHELIHHTHRDGRVYPWKDCFVYRCLQEGSSYRSGDDIGWRKDGTSFPAFYSVEPINESGGITGAVVVVRDMTDEEEQTDRLNHLANHDSLTGLVNRREFEGRLERILQSAKRDHTEHILCYLDLDHFKRINDNNGHLSGDELLRQISALFALHIRKRDTLARLGGDEFAVLMEHCDLNEGKRVARKLRDAVVAYRFQWDGCSLSVGVSIGVVSITQDSATINEVLQAADAACYRAKANGRNAVVVFEQSDLLHQHA